MPEATLWKRPPLLVAVLGTALLTSAMLWARFGTYAPYVAPLVDALTMAIGLWHRRRWLVWTMALTFLLSITCRTLAWPYGSLPSLSEDSNSSLLLIEWFDVCLGATVVHLLLGSRQWLERSHAELTMANAAIVARETEIVQQNEELQAQTEELEQQAEELRISSEELEHNNAELDARERALQVLLQLTRSAADEEQLQREMCALAPRLLGNEALAVAILATDGDYLVVRAHHGVGWPARDEIRLPRRATLANLVMAKNQTGQLDDAALRSDIQLPERPGGAPFRSALAAPLLLHGEAIGALEVYREAPYAWTPRQAQLLGWLASQCAKVWEGARLRDSLREAEQRLRYHIDNSPLATVEWDADFRVRRWTAAAERVFGWPAAAVMGKHPDELGIVFEEDRPRVNGVMARLIDGHERWNVCPNRNYRRDGSVIHCEWYNSVLLDKNGRLVSILSQALDVTERNEAETGLRQTAERLALLSQVGRELQIADQPQGVVEELCRQVTPHAHCDLFVSHLIDSGSDRLQLCAAGGITAVEASRLAWLDSSKSIAAQAVADRKPVIAENITQSTDPRTELVRSLGLASYASFPLLAQTEVLGTLSFGSHTRAVFHADDLEMLQAVADQMAIALQRTRLMRSLEEQARQANAANRAKSEFLANMSHEIRTPMTAIIGFSDLLRQETVAPVDRDEYIGIIQENGRVLLQLINDILDLSKIEAGGTAVEHLPCSPWQIATEVCSLLRVRAEAKSLAINVQYHHPLPETVLTDPTRLRQILVNLVGNAIKFTEHGSVRLDVSFLPTPRPTLTVAVSDTGLGILPESLPKLFKPFSQADSSMSRRFGGTGLGLAISQRLAEMLGGKIRVESVPGQGSKFTLSITVGLPPGVAMLEAAPSVPEKPAPPQETPGALSGRVLLAEDGVDNRRILTLILAKAGLKVDVAVNGREACSMAEQSRGAGTPYDLILMDIQMPEMDGYEATRRLRQSGWSEPIVALTAHATTGDRQRCLEAGCDDYLSKPVTRQRLLEVVGQHLAASSRRTP